jgi:predicted Zn-dependent protease with MMP-like domain
MGAFLRRGDRGSSVMIAVVITAITSLSLASQGEATSDLVRVAAVVLPVSLVLAWLITAKIGSDLAAVQARNLADAARREEMARRMEDRWPAPATDDDEFEAMVDEEMAALPAWITSAIEERNVGVMIDDDPPEDPRTLGLYRTAGGAAQIVLYRRSIMRVAQDPASLRRVIHGTLLHELGHLFGMSESDLDNYTIGNNPRPSAQPVHPPTTGFGGYTG